ncbi:hypothetical protein HYN59_12455 [Flavobacterium album]|uniref:Fibronectin type-III domain-containing protein n=1 Tax=Flavobacterium album TaxID=2175091 RepID=A0A2S1QZT4_9FLAO|nr:choice-of-anchor J domain-containing protein [Flavobacterium album]AWH85864.1 hypothetical protein HYN59_12455 [Flavobacterium album]
MKKQLLLGAFLMASMFTAKAQLSEDFEGTAFPPEGWTVETTNPDATWERFTGNNSIGGTGSAGVGYDFDQDESLISPSFNLAGANPVLTFNILMGYTWGVNPNNNYDVIVSVSNDGGTSWDQVWDESELGVFTDYDIIPVTVQLAAYSGDDIKIKFEYVGNDGDVLIIDDIAVVACAVPSGFSYLDPAPSLTAVNIGWDAPAGSPEGYQFEYGPRGFTQGGAGSMIINPTLPAANLTDLDPSTIYDFYVRTHCGGDDYSEWIGPVSFATLFDAVTPPYNTSFEENNLDFVGWIDGTDPDAGVEPWGVNVAVEGDATVQDGANSLFTFAPTNLDSNAWLLSRGINLTGGSQVTVSFWARNLLGQGATGSASYNLTVGNAQNAAAQTTNIATENDLSSTTFVQKTYTFSPATSGVYYFGINNISPSNPNAQVLLVDNFSVTEILGTKDVLASQLSIFPNPATNVINITNADNILVNGVVIADLNGRTVKSAKFDGVAEAQVNISDLANGMYMMTVSSDKGTMTKKIVKN